jgi:hypothetical protein
MPRNIWASATTWPRSVLLASTPGYVGNSIQWRRILFDYVPKESYGRKMHSGHEKRSEPTHSTSRGIGIWNVLQSGNIGDENTEARAPETVNRPVVQQIWNKPNRKCGDQCEHHPLSSPKELSADILFSAHWIMCLASDSPPVY